MCIAEWNLIAAIVTAVATAILAMLTWLTLMKIKVYVKDTAALARSAQGQLEAIQRPTIVCEIKQDGLIYATNVGPGTAFNLKWTRLDENGGTPMNVSVLGVGHPQILIGKSSFYAHFSEWGIEVRYQSVTDSGYRTLARVVVPVPGAPYIELRFITAES